MQLVMKIDISIDEIGLYVRNMFWIPNELLGSQWS